MSDYEIRINRSQGAVEVKGPDKAWVDDKLTGLARVYEEWTPDASGQPRAAENAAAPSPAPGASPQRGKRAGSRRSARGRAEKNAELDALLTKEVRDKFEAYVQARQQAWAKSRSSQAAIVATFLKDEFDWPGVDHHDIYTLYTAMGFPVPGNIRSQLVNARQRDGFFRGVREGKAELSHAGENFARHASLDGHQP